MTFDYSLEINRSFRYALICSIIFHALVVANWPFYGRLFDKGRLKEIEITYLKVREPDALKKSEDTLAKSQLQAESAQPTKLVTQELPNAGGPKKSEPADTKKDITGIKKDEAKIDRKTSAAQKSKAAVKQPAIPKTETTASVDLKDLHLVPPSYAQTIRNRIIENLDSEGMRGEGDVFVRFVITSKGELKDISIVGEKSSQDSVLRREAFYAVRDSSPFPRFPKDVLTSEITFTCQITFVRK